MRILLVYNNVDLLRFKCALCTLIKITINTTLIGEMNAMIKCQMMKC